LNAGTVSRLTVVSIAKGGETTGAGAGDGVCTGGGEHAATAAIAARLDRRGNFIFVGDGMDTPNNCRWVGYL
jgi:hypothetical protein